MSEHAAASAAGRIVDRGYQHYAGARLGPAHAVRVMAWAAARRAMGIRRSTRAKVFPWLLVLASFAPALFVLAFRVVVPNSSRLPLPGYAALYNQSLTLYLLFAALAAPDLLCADRRERVLSLLFAAPITRLHYVAGQILGLLGLLLLMTLAPMLVLFAGNALLADSAPTYAQQHLGDLWHILLSGLLLGIYYGAIALAVAAFTDRRAYATGAFIGLMLISGAVVPILLRIARSSHADLLALLDLVYLPLRVVRPLFGALVFPDLNPWVCAGVALGVILISLALLVWRYLRTRD